MKRYILLLLLMISLVVASEDFVYEDVDSYDGLDVNDVQGLDTERIPPVLVNQVAAKMSSEQYMALSKEQVELLDMNQVPPDKIPLIQDKLTYLQYTRMSADQVKKLTVSKLSDKNLKVVVNDFSPSQYNEMSSKQISSTYFLVSNIAHLNDDKFNEFVKTKSKDWNDARIEKLEESNCKPCTLSEEGVLSSSKGRATLGKYIKGSLFGVQEDKIVIYPPITEEAFERSRKIRKEKGRNVQTDVQRVTSITDVTRVLANPPKEDKLAVDFFDTGISGTVSVENGKTYYNPGGREELTKNGIPVPLTVAGVQVKSIHKIELIFDNREVTTDKPYLVFNPSRLHGKPGMGAVIEIKGNDYITSFSGDKNDRFIMGFEDDSTEFKLDSRRNLATKEGKRYAPLIEINGDKNAKRLVKMQIGRRFLNVHGSLKVTTLAIGEKDLSSPIVEIQLQENGKLVRTIVTNQENKPQIREASTDLEFLDMSGEEHCVDDKCSFVFSGVREDVVDSYINKRFFDDKTKIPKHLRYVVIGDKSKQRMYVVDVVTGRVVRNYKSSLGQFPGVKTDELAYRKYKKGLKLQFEGNYITPEGRVRMMEDIKPSSNANWKFRALLSYPRPHDVKQAYERGIIDKEERDEYLKQLESIRTNPNRKEAFDDADKLMRSSKTGVGSAILLHGTNKAWANKGWTSAGCYSLPIKNLKELDRKYVGAGSEFIAIPSTNGDVEIKRPFTSPSKWRKEQDKNKEFNELDMEDYLERTGILRANRERLASWLKKN